MASPKPYFRKRGCIYDLLLGRRVSQPNFFLDHVIHLLYDVVKHISKEKKNVVRYELLAHRDHI